MPVFEQERFHFREFGTVSCFIYHFQ